MSYTSLLATVVANRLRHDGILRTVGVLDVVCGVLLLVACGLFVLDLLQVRSAVPAEARRTFDIGSSKALVKNLASVVALLWLGLVSMRLGKNLRRGRREAEESPKLFRGSGSAERP